MLVERSLGVKGTGPVVVGASFDVLMKLNQLISLQEQKWHPNVTFDW